jgi:ATP-dependent exoDNAse (exonuclease V) alpha subunit
MKLRMDSGRTATIRAGDPAHIDHGYAVTSHSAQGATADRVIVHAEGGQSAALVNERFASVAGSRMREGLTSIRTIRNSWHHLSSASSTRPQRYTTGASALAGSSL